MQIIVYYFCFFRNLGVMPMNISKLMPGMGRDNTERYSSSNRLLMLPFSDRSAPSERELFFQCHVIHEVRGADSPSGYSHYSTWYNAGCNNTICKAGSMSAMTDVRSPLRKNSGTYGNCLPTDWSAGLIGSLSLIEGVHEKVPFISSFQSFPSIISRWALVSAP